MTELNKLSLYRICWPMVVIIGLAINLRPSITSVGPLLEAIRVATELDAKSASMLTVLPLMCMGVFPLLLPLVGRRFSENAWITAGLFIIALASFSRLWLSNGAGLIFTAILAGVGIAIIQTLTPGIIKRWYPQSLSLAMGGYSAALMAGGGAVALLSPQVANVYDSWQLGLGSWGVLAILALLFWWLRPKNEFNRDDSRASVHFWSNRRAWLLATYFGLANGVYGCMITWLPTFAQYLGYDAGKSGRLIGVMTVFQVLSALIIPALSSRSVDRRLWLYFAVGIQFLGVNGLIFYPLDMLMAWVAMIGCGLGACFALTLTVALDHLPSPRLAGALASFVQGVGFIITAIIPFIVSLLLEWTGSFQTSWMMLSVTLFLMALFTFKFSPSSYAKVMNI